LIWKLALFSGLYDPETIVIRNTVTDRTFSNSHFDVVEYHEETKSLVLKFKEEILDFRTAPENQLEVISDLKFLVRNVRDWYLQNGHGLSAPVAAQNQAPTFSPVWPLNEDQRHAINQ